jgi:hypothetical protein
MSPGRWALPSGMFSTSPITPRAFTLAFRAASACMRPTTQAAPAMSPFMSSMPPPGLIEMPPESKTTPLPIKATGRALSRAPFQRMMTTRLSRAEPWPTPSSARMLSFLRAFSSSTSTSTPTFSSACARLANSSGPRTFGGSLTRSRARATPAAIPSDALAIFRTAAGSSTAKVSFAGASASSPLPSVFFLVL